AELLGIAAGAGAPAEASGLLELGARVRFRHPLVRSAAYRAATAAQRRDVHRALAEATEPGADPDRRAWHRAHAAAGPDEAVAAELERSAGRARSRGGAAAAAAFLQRAAELTPEPSARAERALAAAAAKVEAAAPDVALDLLATAEIGPLDDLQQARLERLRAQIAFSTTRGSQAPGLLLHAARRLEHLDASAARETYLDALWAAVYAGRLAADGSGVAEVAAAARRGPARPEAAGPGDLLLDGLVLRFTRGYAAAVAPLRKALDAFVSQRVPPVADGRWWWLAWCVACELWDDRTWEQLAVRTERLIREDGALSALPVAVTYRAAVLVNTGHFAAAAALIDEAETLTQVTGAAALAYSPLLLRAWRGRERSFADLVESSTADARVRGEGRALMIAPYTTALLHTALGDYPTALAAAQRACAHDDLGLYAWGLIEVVEAGARAGRPEVAASALERLVERTQTAGTDWALGIEARSRALLARGAAAETWYREATERLGRTRIAVQAARARLLYGEWLRRENRRQDARHQLRRAHTAFSDMGADAFAERARRELLATGEKVRPRTVRTQPVLTAQETQIARLAGEGLTNPEIGSQLFISPRTVEYHLRKVFTKLDISSRRDLRAALGRGLRAASPA
ncbi:MAG TPA: LuxR C-terminal-related transcriptional regulator, partial [Egibacteraceae bacterium]